MLKTSLRRRVYSTRRHSKCSVLDPMILKTKIFLKRGKRTRAKKIILARVVRILKKRSKTFLKRLGFLFSTNNFKFPQFLELRAEILMKIHLHLKTIKFKELLLSIESY